MQARLESLKKAKEKKSPTESTEGKKSKKLQKSQGSKIVDKFIGSLPVKEDVKKLPKGLPSHWGPKVRHKPRPAVTTTSKKSKNQPAKRKWEESKNASAQQVRYRNQQKGGRRARIRVILFKFCIEEGGNNTGQCSRCSSEWPIFMTQCSKQIFCWISLSYCRSLIKIGQNLRGEIGLCQTFNLQLNKIHWKVFFLYEMCNQAITCITCTIIQYFTYSTEIKVYCIHLTKFTCIYFLTVHAFIRSKQRNPRKGRQIVWMTLIDWWTSINRICWPSRTNLNGSTSDQRWRFQEDIYFWFQWKKGFRDQSQFMFQCLCKMKNWLRDN